MATWSLLGAVITMGADLTAASPATLATLTNANLLAIDQDTTGLGYEAWNVSCGSAHCYNWVKPLANGGWAVGLANFDSSTQTVGFTYSNNNMSGTYNAWDAWANSSLGSATGSVSQSVTSHDTGVVILCPGSTSWSGTQCH